MTEAIFNNQDIFEVTTKLLQKIEENAKKSKLGRYRICLHQSQEDIIQEMLIAMTSKSEILPHRRKGTVRTYAIVKGAINLFLFDSKGEEQQKITLALNKVRYVRLSKDFFILPVPLTETVIIHEIAEGPFENNDEYADWFNQEKQNKYFKNKGTL